MKTSDSDIVYKTPNAVLLKIESLPHDFINSNQKYSKLIVLGWLTILYLLTTLSLITSSFVGSVLTQNEVYIFIADVLSLLDGVLYIYLMLMFKNLVNNRLECQSADRYIYIILVLSSVITAISIFMSDDTEMLGFFSISFFILLALLGIVSILFGLRLLKIDSDFNYLKLFSWSTIIAGGLLASVVLFILAIPVGFVATYAMAMMFFSAAHELKSYQENVNNY
jgi:hypothetical protein